MSVTGKTAVVTGAATGIGRATAELLAARGARVVAAGLQPELLRETVAGIAAAGGEAIAVDADLVRPAATRRSPRARRRPSAAPTCSSTTPRSTRSARGTRPTPRSGTPCSPPTSAATSCSPKALRPQMLARGGGSIVNVASVTFFWGEVELLSYVASKGAVVGFTRSLAREAGPEGIRVNAVAPGAFPTAATAIHADQDKLWRDVLEAQSIKRRGEVEDVARAIAFFAGEDSRFVTGQTLLVDGGWMRN